MTKMKTKNSHRKRKHDVWKDIEEHRKNPEYIKAVREFIHKTTS